MATPVFMDGPQLASGKVNGAFGDSFDVILNGNSTFTPTVSNYNGHDTGSSLNLILTTSITTPGVLGVLTVRPTGAPSGWYPGIQIQIVGNVDPTIVIVNFDILVWNNNIYAVDDSTSLIQQMINPAGSNVNDLTSFSITNAYWTYSITVPTDFEATLGLPFTGIYGGQILTYSVSASTEWVGANYVNKTFSFDVVRNWPITGTIDNIVVPLSQVGTFSTTVEVDGTGSLIPASGTYMPFPSNPSAFNTFTNLVYTNGSPAGAGNYMLEGTNTVTLNPSTPVGVYYVRYKAFYSGAPPNNDEPYKNLEIIVYNDHIAHDISDPDTVFLVSNPFALDPNGASNLPAGVTNQPSQPYSGSNVSSTFDLTSALMSLGSGTFDYSVQSVNTGDPFILSMMYTFFGPTPAPAVDTDYSLETCVKTTNGITYNLTNGQRDTDSVTVANTIVEHLSFIIRTRQQSDYVTQVVTDTNFETLFYDFNEVIDYSTGLANTIAFFLGGQTVILTTEDIEFITQLITDYFPIIRKFLRKIMTQDPSSDPCFTDNSTRLNNCKTNCYSSMNITYTPLPITEADPGPADPGAQPGLGDTVTAPP